MGEGGNASPHRGKITGNGRGWGDRNAAIPLPQHHPKTICICRRSLKVEDGERRGGGVIGFPYAHGFANISPLPSAFSLGLHSSNLVLFSLALLVVMIPFHTYI